MIDTEGKFVLFYSKDDQIYPVVMSEEQFGILNDIAVKLVFSDGTVKVIDKSCGTVYQKGGQRQCRPTPPTAAAKPSQRP